MEVICSSSSSLVPRLASKGTDNNLFCYLPHSALCHLGHLVESSSSFGEQPTYFCVQSAAILAYLRLWHFQNRFLGRLPVGNRQ